MYTVEYCDGYYIEKDGEPVLDLANPEDKEFADFVCAALNAKEDGFCGCCRGAH